MMPKIKKSIGIYIPTKGRVSEDRQVTLKEITSKSDFSPKIVCPPSEKKQHQQWCDHVITCPKKGIGNVRQWILENASESIILMVDDDMKFQFRPDPDSVKLEQCEDLNPMFEECRKTISQGYIHGGVSARQGNNHVKEWAKDNKRNCNFHFLDRLKVLETGARFDQLPVMEDFHFTLSLLTQGFPNRVLYGYCWNQLPGSIGGCNLYRTLDLQEEAANGLKKEFPEFVTIVDKTNKTNWSIAKGTRKDVRVQWQKAYKSSSKE